MTFTPTPLSKILASEVVPVEAAKAPAPAAPAAVPDKYEGKSTAEVIEMHQNAESALGRANSEVGNLRGLVSDLSSVQRATETPVTVVEPVTLSGEELLGDPAAAIRSVLQPELDAIRDAQTETATLTAVQSESQALMQAHGDVDAIVQSESFMAFVARTAGRQGDFEVAAHGEGINQVRAARRLLDDYADFNAATTPKQAPAVAPVAPVTPVQAAAAVANEGANTGAPVSTKPQMFEADVIDLIRTDRAKYLSPSFQKDMMEAIKDGRFVKQS